MDVIMSGVVVQVLPVESGVSQKSGQPWMKQSYVLQYEQGQYPRHICFEIFGQDKIQQFAIRQGERIAVHLNFNSKPNVQNPAKWFNEVRCWGVDRMGQQMYAQQGQMQDGWPQQQGWQQPMQQPAPQQYQQPVQQGWQQPVPQPAPAPFPPQPAPQQQMQQPMAQQPAPQPAPAPFLPQVDANGNPVQQQVQQNSGLPFPPAQ